MISNLKPCSGSVGLKSETACISFNDLYSMLDGMMLYGASIRCTHHRMKQYRVEISRRRRQWKSLVYPLFVMETHGFAMCLQSGVGSTKSSDKLSYRSLGTRLFEPAYQRWYRRNLTGGVEQCWPEDFDLTEPVLAMWCLGLFFRKQKKRQLTAVSWTLRDAELIQQQMIELGFDVKLSTNSGIALKLPKNTETELKAWLEQRFGISALLWDCDTGMTSHIKAKPGQEVAHGHA